MIYAPVSMKISTKISSFSCVGVKGDFPRGFGNYIGLKSPNKKKNHPFLDSISVINLSYEDLEDAIKLGLVGKTIEADVYTTENGKLVAFVTDTRLPEKARSPRWWYENRFQFAESVIRKEFGLMDDSICVCESGNEKAENAIFTMTYSSNKEKKYVCMCCKKTKTIFIQ